MPGNFAVFDHLLNRLTNYEVQMKEYVLTIFHSDELQDLVTKFNEDQLQEGKRADDSVITPEYAPATIRYKKKKGDPYDRVTLHDYGDFYGGLRLKQYATKMELVSQDPKSEALQEKYKPTILGLNDQHMVETRQWIYPQVFNYSNRLLR